MERKKNIKNKESIRELLENATWHDTCVTGVPEEGEGHKKNI